MNDELDKQRPETAEAERDIRQGRKFTPQEAIARLAGPGAMKGASPVSRLQQAELEIGSWLGTHVVDDEGALKGVMQRQLKGSRLLLSNIDQPLVALAEYCSHILASHELLKELVREVDVEWGRRMAERPYFEIEGSSPDANDPYSIQSVRKTLDEMRQVLP